MTIASVMKAPEANDHAALAETMPLDEIDVSNPALYQQHVWQPYFRRLRREAPVHYCKDSPIGPYWSVTKYNDIMHVDTNHGIFSSDVSLGGISIRDVPPGYDWPSFIAMDQPRHSAQRKTVSPMFTPKHLDELAILIRERAPGTFVEVNCAAKSQARSTPSAKSIEIIGAGPSKIRPRASSRAKASRSSGRRWVVRSATWAMPRARSGAGRW